MNGYKDCPGAIVNNLHQKSCILKQNISYFGTAKAEQFLHSDVIFITGPPNRPVLFCTLSSSSAGRHCKAGPYGYVPLGDNLFQIT